MGKPHTPHIWYSICFSVISRSKIQDPTIIEKKMVKIVDHVMSFHNGLIHKLKLSYRELQGTCDNDRRIMFLSQGSNK